MKNLNQLIAISLVATFCFIITSCDKENSYISQPLASSELPMPDAKLLGISQLTDIGMEVGLLIENLPSEPSSRSAQAISDYAMQVSVTEENIAKCMQPMVKVGSDIRQASLEMIKSKPLQCEVTQEEIQILESLTDEELAGIGFMISALCSNDNDAEILNNDALMQNRYIECLVVALGIDGIIDIFQGGGSIGAIVAGTKGLINAKTMVQVLKSLGMRYLGWIGVGIMVYDYANCVRNGH
ncbi:MAG: hypothetical protein K2G49_07150 [Muribaculum sp.]|nr:hypothetical protein [Muribaculum sp.]